MERTDVPGLAGTLETMKVLLFANTDWYLYNFRLALARALRDAGAEVVLVSPDGPYGERLRAAGFRWLPVPMSRRSLNPLREVALLARLVMLYRRERPDVAHHFTIKCVVYGSLAGRMAGISRRINAVAGLGYVFASASWRARMLRPPVRGLLRLALAGEDSRLIVQNADDRAVFEQAALTDPARIRLIRGSGVDATRFQPATRPRPLGSPTRVLFAARLLWVKGLGEFVEAARRLKAEGVPAEFFVAGAADRGNPAAVPVEVTRRWAAEGLVTLLGHIEDMAICLTTVDLVVLPSYREGLPRNLIEAAAAGLPVVACDVPGCREAVRHGNNGLLVPARDPAALAGAIRELCTQPALRARMGAAGRAIVLREFSQNHILRATIDVYREVLPQWLN